MADKTPKADALRRMREEDSTKVGPFRMRQPPPRPKWKRELSSAAAAKSRKKGKEQ